MGRRGRRGRMVLRKGPVLSAGQGGRGDTKKEKKKKGPHTKAQRHKDFPESVRLSSSKGLFYLSMPQEERCFDTLSTNGVVPVFVPLCLCVSPPFSFFAPSRLRVR